MPHCGPSFRRYYGPELVSVRIAEWAEEHSVKLDFIRPGKPMQNGFIERFNRSYREAVLDMYVFQSLDEVREQTERWLKEYNESRTCYPINSHTQPRTFRNHCHRSYASSFRP
jgi:putative transposase